MRHALVWIAAIWTLAAGGMAAAQERAVVVELFTSQGCSSCPPADALLAELAGRDDVVPLALHVDYWDYLGWRDSFAQPAFSERQKGYALQAGRRTVYTPEIVVQGSHAIMGAKAMKLADLIRAHAARPEPVSLRITREGGSVTIAVAPREGAVAPSDIQVVRYLPSRIESIHRGENAGHQITYTHIVTDWQVVARWDGLSAWTGQADAPGDAPVVVLVQAADQGPILASARLR